MRLAGLRGCDCRRELVGHLGCEPTEEGTAPPSFAPPTKAQVLAGEDSYWAAFMCFLCSAIKSVCVPYKKIEVMM